jgi:hypothetical protein
VKVTAEDGATILHYDVTITRAVPRAVQSIAVNYTGQANYGIGEPLDIAAIAVDGTYNTAPANEAITINAANISGNGWNSGGYFTTAESNKTVTVTVDGKVDTFTITIQTLAERIGTGGTQTVTVYAEESLAPTTLSAAGTLTLNGGGHTLTLNANDHLFRLGTGAELTLNNVILEGNGYQRNGVFVDGGSTLHLNDATIQGFHNSGVIVWGGTADMNGGSITGNSGNNAGGVNVYNGSFSLYSGDISGNTTSSDGGGVYVSLGTFNQSGGTISRKQVNQNGVGVYVANNATFNQSGGDITNNTATGNGGGVYVIDAGSAFTQSGGDISNNTANEGGGVYVNSGGTFTQSDGAINVNNANWGGGVRVYGGTFTQSGGTITGNTVTNNTYGGGGVFVDYSGTFTQNGGTITGNSATTGKGGGVYLYGGTFILVSGSITADNTAPANQGSTLYNASAVAKYDSVGGADIFTNSGIGYTSQALPTSGKASIAAND